MANDDSATTWHLCWQAAVGRQIFTDADLYQRVRHRLLDAHRRRGRVLIDYLMLPREIHVVCRITAEDSPGRIARAIGNVVARWVRELQPVRSPVFAGPFVAVRIADSGELKDEARMLAWRPVLLGLCQRPVHYTHSALRTVLGQRPAQGFDARPLLREFADSIPEARKAMRKGLARRPAERDVRQWLLLSGLETATGSTGLRPSATPESRRPAIARLVAAGGADGVAGALRLLERWVRVRLGDGAPPSAGPQMGNAHARALVACLAVDNDLCSAASVARHFGKAKSTLSEQMSACRKRSADRLTLLRPIETILREALALEAEERRTNGE